MALEPKGQATIVTGGASAIGDHAALLFAAEGVDLIIDGFNGKGAGKVAKEIAATV